MLKREKIDQLYFKYDNKSIQDFKQVWASLDVFLFFCTFCIFDINIFTLLTLIIVNLFPVYFLWKYNYVLKFVKDNNEEFLNNSSERDALLQLIMYNEDKEERNRIVKNYLKNKLMGTTYFKIASFRLEKNIVIKTIHSIDFSNKTFSKITILSYEKKYNMNSVNDIIAWIEQMSKNKTFVIENKLEYSEQVKYLKDNINYVDDESTTKIDQDIKAIYSQIQNNLKDFILKYVQEQENKINDMIRNQKERSKKELLTQGKLLVKNTTN